jgi:hypothetical protein
MRLDLEQFDSHGFEVGNDFNSRTLCSQGSRVTTSARVHAGNDGTERWTKGVSRSGVVNISAHDNLELSLEFVRHTVGLSDTNGI